MNLSDNQTIKLINDSDKLRREWKKIDKPKRREVVEAVRHGEKVEKAVREIVTGQRELFD